MDGSLILVTGATGTVGSEVVRASAATNPRPARRPNRLTPRTTTLAPTHRPHLKDRFADSPTVRTTVESSAGGDDPAGGFDGGGAALRDEGGVVGHGVGVRQVRPGQADREEQDDEVEGPPCGVDVAAGLGGFDGGDSLGGDVLAIKN